MKKTLAAKAPKAKSPKATPNDSIETIARALCQRQLSAFDVVDRDMAAGIDRYWPCVAAELEAGLIDAAGNRLVPFDYEASQAAYRAWVQRHA